MFNIWYKSNKKPTYKRSNLAFDICKNDIN